MLRETPAQILLVYHDPAAASSTIAFLKSQSHTVEWVEDHEKAFNCLETHPFDVLLTEIDVPRIDGMRLMDIARNRNPEICVILIAESPEIELATQAMRQGAYDFQAKPLNLARLAALIQRGLSYQKLLHERQDLRRRLDERFGITGLIGNSPAIGRLCENIRHAAPTDVPIILVGESGTGKNHVSKIIHNNSRRSDAPLVTLNCTTSPSLIQRELCGYLAGTFPGASESVPGRLELADGGTIHLRNARNLPRMLCQQLIQTIQQGQTQRLGDDKTISTNVRILVSITPDIDATDPTHEFLRELQNRFNALTVDLPPLRDHPEDIPILMKSFMKEISQTGQAPALSQDAIEILTAYDWPGNVQEFKDTIQEIILRGKSKRTITALDIPDSIRATASQQANEILLRIGTPMQEVEKIVIQQTLKACDFKKEEAARQLGIGLRTLYRKLKAYDAE